MPASSCTRHVGERDIGRADARRRGDEADSIAEHEEEDKGDPDRKKVWLHSVVVEWEGAACGDACGVVMKEPKLWWWWSLPSPLNSPLVSVSEWRQCATLPWDNGGPLRAAAAWSMARPAVSERGQQRLE